MRSAGVVIAAILVVSGCAARQDSDPFVWTRVDGRRIQEFPQMQTVFTVDKTACEGQMQRANVSGPACRGLDCSLVRGDSLDKVFQGCMAEKGYLYMRTSQAVAYTEAKNPRPAAKTKAK